MKSIILFGLIALSVSSTFLRDLAGEVDLTITGLKGEACQALPTASSFVSFTTTVTGQTAITSGNEIDFGVKFYEGNNLKSATTCNIAGTTNADLNCKVTTQLEKSKKYTVKAAANKIDTKFSVKEWTGADIAFTDKTYVAPGSQTAQKLEYTDDKFNFTVVFAADVTDVPTIKVNGTAVDCTVVDTKKTTVTCLMKKDSFKTEDKEKPYIATITNVCGVDEEKTVTINASSSFITVSKLFILIAGLFLF